MKKILSILTILIAVFIGINTVNAVPKVDNSKKVYDYAERLTDDEEQKLEQQISEYTEEYDMDFVFVVLNNYTGSLQSYAQDFYDYNDFGVGKTHDGVIIVLNYDSLGIDCWITTTGNAILMYDDTRINYLKQRMSSVKNQGTYTIFSSVLNLASSQADSGIPSSNKDYYIDKNGDYVRKRSFPFMSILVVALLAAGIPTIVFVCKNKMIKKATMANEYLQNGSVSIYNRQDHFVSTHTSSHTISSSSGGGSGGSSISRGSSGRSHGGGGGRL